MTEPMAMPNLPPLVSIVVGANGQVQIECHVPKIEAVKLLATVLEELRLQSYREQDRVIQVARP